MNVLKHMKFRSGALSLSLWIAIFCSWSGKEIVGKPTIPADNVSVTIVSGNPSQAPIDYCVAAIHYWTTNWNGSWNS